MMKFEYETYDSEHCVTIKINDKPWVTVSEEAGPVVPERFEIWEGLGPKDDDDGETKPLSVIVKRTDENTEQAWDRALVRGHELAIAALKELDEQERREAEFFVLVKNSEDKLEYIERMLATHFELSPENMDEDVLRKVREFYSHLELATDVGDRLIDP